MNNLKNQLKYKIVDVFFAYCECNFYVRSNQNKSMLGVIYIS